MEPAASWLEEEGEPGAASVSLREAVGSMESPRPPRAGGEPEGEQPRGHTAPLDPVSVGGGGWLGKGGCWLWGACSQRAEKEQNS